MVAITVRDTMPPTIDATASPLFLWPPDGRMVEVGFRVTASDRCDPAPAIALLEVTTLDVVGGRPGPAVLGADLGSDDRAIALRADRSGAGTGRIYTITYRAADRSGNRATTSALVIVPHDARR